MEKILSPNQFLQGKVIKKIDYSSPNRHFILFEDGTSVCVECENISDGTIGLVWYKMRMKGL